MRQEFFRQLFMLMQINPDVYFITGDLGFGLADKIRDTHKDRFINAGAAEQAMMGAAIGLALQGKIPVVYSITPFLLFRPFEAIRNYVDYEQIPVILVGSGRARDYDHDGFSHWADDDVRILSRLTNIKIMFPFKENFDLFSIIDDKQPTYINLSR